MGETGADLVEKALISPVLEFTEAIAVHHRADALLMILIAPEMHLA